MDPLTTVKRLEGGRFLEQLHKALAQVANEVAATKNKGAVTVKIEVIPEKRGGDFAIALEVHIERKMPKRKPHGVLAFAKDGQLFRDEPGREPLEGFREVLADDTETRNVAAPAAAVREA